MAVGDIIEFGGSTAPAGRLLCDGAAVSRSTYAGLFAIVGTTYGVGDGSTTFNVPNTSGKTIVFEVNTSTSEDLELRLITDLEEATTATADTYGHVYVAGVSKKMKPSNYGTKSSIGLGNVPNTDFTSAVAANTAKNTYPSGDSTKVANVPSNTNTELAAKFNLSELDVTDLGTNPTAWDMSSRKVAVAKAVITSGITITKSNDSNLRSVELWLDNTNDNTIVMAGLDFKGSLPDGVAWTLGGSTLVFTSADGEYQILGSKNPLTSGLIICNIQKVD